MELRNQPPLTRGPDGGFPYLLGTDPLGRDILSRLLHGARTSLAVGFTSVVALNGPDRFYGNFLHKGIPFVSCISY
jgi:hypothetical protein